MAPSTPESVGSPVGKTAARSFVSLGIIGQGIGLVLWSFKNPIAAFASAIGILLFAAAEAELSRVLKEDWRERRG